MRTIVLVISMLMFGAAATRAQEFSSATTEKIWQKTASTYASAQTYLDSGQVNSVSFYLGKPPEQGIRTFSTAFVRPDAFRLEVQHRGGYGHMVIWKQGSAAGYWN